MGLDVYDVHNTCINSKFLKAKVSVHYRLDTSIVNSVARRGLNKPKWLIWKITGGLKLVAISHQNVAYFDFQFGLFGLFPNFLPKMLKFV